VVSFKKGRLGLGVVMYRNIFRKLKKTITRKYDDINPEDIFIDSANLPGFEEHALEGRIEKPMGRHAFLIFKIILIVVVIMLSSKLWSLGIINGAIYAEISENNRLEQTIVFSNRGIIFDRNLIEVASNEVKGENDDFAKRYYPPFRGLSHVVGYLKYPLADRQGIYYEKNYRGRDGVERAFDSLLRGENGTQLRETDVFGNVTSESIIKKPIDGNSIVLSIDAKLTEELYKSIEGFARSNGFVGGAGVIMDVETGEILAMTSFPEYDQNLLTSGADQATIDNLINNQAKPFLNRSIGGLYTPGSIIKPILALGALNEDIISPEKKILSTGSITIPNPYDPSKPSVFGDWRAHGWTDMREAIAVSSDTYFYSIGGGFGNQKGLGITRIDKYLQMFGLTELTGFELPGEVAGVIPTPEWKRERFDGDIWRLGDTYITSIGQYGTLVTPLNAARFTAAIANKGKILTPSILIGGRPMPLGGPVERVMEFSEADWKVIHDGMRAGVTYGTSGGLNVPYVKIAAKTGTAEIGAAKLYVHSWSVGYWPSDNPKYSWAVVMERGPSRNTIGATAVMRRVFDWMNINAPEYLIP
jgi:penicillin-binding protein 2